MLRCPYCRQEFDPNEMLFYTDTRDSKFLYPNDAARNATATMSAGAVRQATQVRSVRAGSRSLVQRAENDDQAEKKEQTPKEFPLGESCEDNVAKEFLAPYGEGRLFRFQRIATFYGIKSKLTLDAASEEETKGYGYIYKYEDAAQTIPSTLMVPSRPENKQRLTHRVCPKCHCDIPAGFFETPEEKKHYAALAGCTSSGKTQFVTVALRELKVSLGALNLGSLNWTECSGWFYEMYLEKYKKTGGRNEATNTDIVIFPLMFSVVRNDTRERHFITIFDCAGEYSENSDYAANLKGFEEADTLLLMIDSLQFFRDQARKLGDGENACKDEYTRALRTIADNNLCQNVRQVITVITKCDTILGRPGLIHGSSAPGIADGMLAYEYDMSCHAQSVDIRYIRQVDAELEEMLNRNQQSNVKNNISGDIHAIAGPPDVNLTAVSTYYHNGDALVRDVDAEMGHHRLIEPLLYAMALWNVLPWKDNKEEPIEIPPNYVIYTHPTDPKEEIPKQPQAVPPAQTTGESGETSRRGLFKGWFGRH